jgi:hypothetical protein
LIKIPETFNPYIPKVSRTLTGSKTTKMTNKKKSKAVTKMLSASFDVGSKVSSQPHGCAWTNKNELKIGFPLHNEIETRDRRMPRELRGK